MGRENDAEVNEALCVPAVFLFFLSLLKHALAKQHLSPLFTAKINADNLFVNHKLPPSLIVSADVYTRLLRVHAQIEINEHEKVSSRAGSAIFVARKAIRVERLCAEFIFGIR